MRLLLCVVLVFASVFSWTSVVYARSDNPEEPVVIQLETVSDEETQSVDEGSTNLEAGTAENTGDAAAMENAEAEVEPVADANAEPASEEQDADTEQTDQVDVADAESQVASNVDETGNAELEEADLVFVETDADAQAEFTDDVEQADVVDIESQVDSNNDDVADAVATTEDAVVVAEETDTNDDGDADVSADAETIVEVAIVFDETRSEETDEIADAEGAVGVEETDAEALAEAETILTNSEDDDVVVPDPYFFVGGVKHSYLPTGGDCQGAANCAVSASPIQDAINAVSGGLSPDDGTIYIEGGDYAENILVDSLSSLVFQGAADGGASTLSGALSITNSQSITWRDFTFVQTITVDNSTDITITGTDGDDKIDVTLAGSGVSSVTVESGAGDDDISIHGDASDTGTVDVDGGDGTDALTNDGVVRNAINIEAYTQTTKGNLGIEIGGSVQGLDYSYIGNGGAAVLDGKLSVTLANGFSPSVGDTFEILTFNAGSLSGVFDSAVGLYGFGDGSLYFELLEGTDRIQLVTKKAPGFGAADLIPDAVAGEDTLGRFFNVDYFGYGSYTLDASLEVDDFFAVSGSFGLENRAVSLILSDASSVMADLWGFSASGLNAFAGLNPGDAGKIGLSLGAVEFALALLRERANPNREWTSLQASVGNFSFVGGDDIQISGSTIDVAINLAAGDDTVINYDSQNLTLAAGSKFTMAGADGELVQVSGDLTVEVADFFQVTGGLAFKKSAQQVTLDDGSKVKTDMLTLGGTGVDAFAGLNGGSADALGLSLSAVDFTVVLLADQADTARKWTTVFAAAESVAFQGSSDITLSGENLSVMLNLAASDNSVVDYLAQPLDVAVGAGQTLTINFDGGQGQLIKVAGDFKLNVYNFFYIEGGLAFEKYTTQVILTDGNPVDVDLLTLGGAGIEAFLGLNGGTNDAMGFDLSDVGYALALLTDQANSSRRWISLQGTVGAVSAQANDWFGLSGEDLSVEINLAATDNTLVNYAAQNLAVTTGPGQSYTFTMDGSLGELMQASGAISLSVVDFLNIEGNFAFEKSSQALKLAGNVDVTVDLITIGADGVSAFAGLNGGTADAIGLSLGGVGFALAFMTDKNDKTRQWLSLKASASSFLFDGVENITISGGSLAVEINKAADDDSLVDYAAQSLVIPTGPDPNDKVTFDMAASDGELIRASGNLTIEVASFFRVSGGFAVKKATQQVNLDNGDKVDADMLAIGAENAAAFAGLNGGTLDALGLTLSNLTFGVLLLTDQADPSRQWIAAQAKDGAAAFVGIDGLTLSGDSLQVQINLAANDGTLVDFLAHSLDVGTGPSTSITFNMDAQQGEIIKAAGNLKINLFNFFSISGGFAFEKYITQVTLSDQNATQINVNVLALGGANVDAFVGLNGPSTGSGQGGTTDAFGLNLRHAYFALALLSEVGGTGRQWTSLQVAAGAVAFVGIDDLTMSAESIEVTVNYGNVGDTVVDYAVQPLTVTTGPGQSLTLNMDGGKGRMIQAAAALDIDLFGFFNVEGQFAINKSIETVTLSTGDQIQVDLISFGGSGINAFAGLNGGSPDAVGLYLGEVDFAFALMTDRNDSSKKFTSLKAKVGNASLAGIDGMVIEADTLEVAINQGYEVPAKPEVVTKANTIYQLDIFQNTLGTLTFNLGGDSQSFDLTPDDSDASILSKITSALEALGNIGAGNVQVSGDRFSGYLIEFMGALEGVSVANLAVDTAAAGVLVSVIQIGAAVASVDEVKRITIETLRSAPVPVNVTVTEVSQAVAGKNEIKELFFSSPYSSSGTYDIEIGGVTETVTFRGSMTLPNKTNIKNAFLSILGASSSEITVYFGGSHDNGHRYKIFFEGNLAQQDIPDMVVTNNLSTDDVYPFNIKEACKNNFPF